MANDFKTDFEVEKFNKMESTYKLIRRG